jgi:hypothetical protein
MILHAVKLGRLEGRRNKADTYIDGINYFAFAASFATAGEILLTCIHTFFGVAEWGDMTQDR